MARMTKRMKGADGVEIATHHLGGSGPPVMLVHATGFHGHCWEPLAEHLAGEFAVWAVDQRGHGASGKAPDGRYEDWDRFVDDLLAVIDGLGTDGWQGLGHSLGGAVLLMAEARRPGTFSSLCCYEPVVMFPDRPLTGGPTAVSLADLARKRQASFPTGQAALDNYRSKPPFKAFHPTALEAYVKYGFVDNPDGTVTLACARDDEASVFDGAPRSRAASILPDVRCPVAVMAGTDPSEPLARVALDVARHLPRGGFTPFDGLDHFGPMVDPARVAATAAFAFGSRSTIVVPPPS